MSTDFCLDAGHFSFTLYQRVWIFFPQQLLVDLLVPLEVYLDDFEGQAYSILYCRPTVAPKETY